MSQEGWIREPDGGQEPPPERLPRVEDLPRAEHGYERAAVEAAFDAFYRHAARLDATLRTLEAVEAFQRQAGDLRKEIRALRAASWGPLPARQAWSAGYSAGPISQPGGAMAEVLPRLAVEAALILLVAVGAALADLSTAWIVLLVLAAWFVVGLSEVAASTGIRPPRLRRAPATAVAEAQPSADPGETMIAPPPSLLEDEGEPEEEAVALPEPEPEPELEPELEPEVPPGRRPWRRRARASEPEAPAELEPPRHVRVLQAETATTDPWERAPDLPPGGEELVEEPEPQPELEAEPEPEPSPAEEVEAEAEPEPEPPPVAAPPVEHLQPVLESPAHVHEVVSADVEEHVLEERASRKVRGRFWSRSPAEASDAVEIGEAGEESAEAGEETGELEPVSEADVQPPPRDEHLIRLRRGRR